MAKLKIKQTDASGQAHDSFISPTLINGNHYGGVGGLTSQSGLQIAPVVKVGSNGAAVGSIIAQKGAHKFRVTDGTNKGTCTLSNATTLGANQMNLWANICQIPLATLAAANVAGGATSTTISWSAGTTVGPVATPRVGDYITGFAGLSANVSTSSFGLQVTAVNSATQVTVATTGNIAAVTGILANTLTLVSHVDNKFIRDFTSDGSPDSTTGTVTYYTSGYNPTKFRYVLGGNVTATFARLQSA
jgi:hypothetical protein